MQTKLMGCPPRGSLVTAAKAIALGAPRWRAARRESARLLVADDAVQDGALVEIGEAGLGLPAEEVARDLEYIVLRAALFGLCGEEVAQVARLLPALA